MAVIENTSARDFAAMDESYVPPAARSSLAYNANIHYLRGLAALLVMLSHSGYYLKDYLSVSWARTAFPDLFGLYGVAVFFAISGYLMASLIVKEKPVDFLARRIVRIYPLFIVCTFFTMLMLFPQVIPRWVPLSLTLAPMDDATYVMRVEWTIVNEVFFYVAVFLVALAGLQRWLPAIAVVWLCAIWGASYFRVGLPPIGRAGLIEIGLMTANAGFAAGLLIPTVARYFRFPLLSLIGFVCLLFVQHNFSSVYARVIAGGASALLVLAAIQQSIHPPRVLHIGLTKLGDWSYALYLIHVPIITYVYAIHRGTDAPWFVWPAAVALALFMGALFGELDQMMTDRGKRIVKASSLKTLQIVAAAFMTMYLAAAVISNLR